MFPKRCAVGFGAVGKNLLLPAARIKGHNDYGGYTKQVMQAEESHTLLAIFCDGVRGLCAKQLRLWQFLDIRHDDFLIRQFRHQVDRLIGFGQRRWNIAANGRRATAIVSNLPTATDRSVRLD